MEWISVEQALPEEMALCQETVNVLISEYVFRQVDIGFYAYDTRKWYYSEGNAVDLNGESITHWMPLPTAPK